MKVVIVGGGIVGLTTAVALRRSDRHITVLERSQMLKETGALISLQPNASKIATSLGLDGFLGKYGPMADTAFRICDQSGRLVRELPLDTSRFGADRVLYHRKDLHAALREAATSRDLPGTPVEIRPGCKVESADPDRGTVTVEGGETISADLIVGADGIRSVLRELVVGEPRPAIPTGTSAYRMLVPVELLADAGVPRDVFDPTKLDPTKSLTTMIIGYDRRVIMGLGRNGTLFGIVALIPDNHTGQAAADNDSWVTEGPLEDLLAAYDGFPDWLLEMFKRAPDHALWQLRDIDPLPTWFRGRAILVGDAAHAMLPTQGQGASQGFEDAEALQAYIGDLAETPSAGEVSEALQRVFEARWERASRIQKYSRDQAKPGTTKSDVKEVKLDPGQFMAYNCDYSGAKDWVARKSRGMPVDSS